MLRCPLRSLHAADRSRAMRAEEWGQRRTERTEKGVRGETGQEHVGTEREEMGGP